MLNLLNILKVTMHHSLVDLLWRYPPKIYLVSWVPRVLTQVAFFAVLVSFVAGQDKLLYALVGNAVYVLASSVINGVTASVTWERRAGTLALLVASPTNPLLVFTGRNVGMATHGLMNGLVGMYVVAPLLGMPLTLAEALMIFPALLAVTLGSYGLGVLMGSFALYARGYQNVVSNSAMLLMLVVCGVNYPVSALPAALQGVAQGLPLTHGLHAIRDILAGAPFASVLPLLGLEVLIGAAYALVAQLVIGNLVYKARHAGTIDYS
jgi:ABC-2 type transport system permease protein